MSMLLNARSFAPQERGDDLAAQETQQIDGLGAKLNDGAGLSLRPLKRRLPLPH